MNLIGYRTIKTALGVVFAILIARAFNLQYYTSAGIITILSIQNTRRLSYNLAIQRIVAWFIALLLSLIIFTCLGYNPFTFGLIILLFIPIAVKLKLAEGIVVNSVLVSHLLIDESVSFSLLLNETWLLTIGVLVALFLNLYMPSNENKIKEDIRYIDSKIKEILFQMSKSLKEQTVSIQEELNFNLLDERLKVAEKHALINVNNSFINTRSNFYSSYIEMRYQQYSTLKTMRQHFQRIFMTYTFTLEISKFTEEVSNSINERNNADRLLVDLNTLRSSFKNAPLPTTREEFENRAMLYQFLNDLELFLKIKKRFHLKYNG